jgi:hypothetical protein
MGILAWEWRVRFCLILVFNEAYHWKFSGLILFHVVSLMSSFIMFLMAMKWSVIMQYWRCQEEIFLKHPYSTQGLALKWKVKLATIVVIVPAFGILFPITINIICSSP